ncbi:MAG: hypothetical protein ABIC68_03920 [Candidatus Omnitrophota bacterium]
MRKIHSWVVIGILLSLFFMCPSPALAGLRIDKPKVKMEVTPGDYENGVIRVENRNGQTSSIRVYLEDWVSSGDDRTGSDKVFMPKGTTPLSCSNWISFSPADFVLAPGEARDVQYTVSLPKEAKGGYYSVMFFESQSGTLEKLNEQGENVSVKVLNRLGALFYVQAEGTINKTAELRNLDISYKLNDLVVSGDFVNTGNTDISVTGTFNVIDGQGFVYARGEFNKVFVLPTEKGVLTARSDSVDLKAGSYGLLITLDFVGGGSIVEEVPFTVSANGSIQV